MKRHLPICVLVALALLTAGLGLSTAGRSDAAIVVKISPAIDAKGNTDVSAQMAAFFRSVPDGATVLLPAGAKYRMESTLVLDHRHNLVVEGNGAQFFMRTPGDLKRSSLIVQNSSYIVIRDLVIKGANPHGGAFADAHQSAREGQHGISLMSDSIVWLINNTVTDVYGDFVYLARVSPHDAWTNGVVIMDNHFARNGRQGITITDSRNVAIGRNTITDIARATFDFEPMAPTGGVDNVSITGNTIGVGRLLLVAAEGADPVNNVTISGNHVTGQNLQIWIGNVNPGRRAGWKVLGNTTNTLSGNPNQAAMLIQNVNGIEIRDNVQGFNLGRQMVLADFQDSCGIAMSGNHIPGSVGSMRVSGHC